MKKPAILRTVYPISYNKNGNRRDLDFNEWQEYIRLELGVLPQAESLIINAKKILQSK